MEERGMVTFTSIVLFTPALEGYKAPKWPTQTDALKLCCRGITGKNFNANHLINKKKQRKEIILGFVQLLWLIRF